MASAGGKLLSDYARSFLVPEHKKSFWENIKASLGLGQLEASQGAIGGGNTEEDYSNSGFVPFADIGDFRVLARADDSQNLRELVLFYDESSFDLYSLKAAAGENDLFNPGNFKSLVLYILYVNAITEDHRLDPQEQQAMIALVRFLDLKPAEVLAVQKLTYAFMTSILLGDYTIDKDEKVALENLAQKFDLDPTDILTLHLNKFIIQVRDLLEKENLSGEDLDAAVQLAEDLSLPPQEIRQHLLLLEDKVFENCCNTGNLPEISDPPIMLKKGEKAHFTSPVKVIEQKTEAKTRRYYAGTRLKLGKLPIYLGSSSPSTSYREVIRDVGEGVFVITNKRIVCIGTKINYSIPLERINDLSMFSNALQIHNEGRFGGRFYLVDRPQRAFVMINALSKKKNKG